VPHPGHTAFPVMLLPNTLPPSARAGLLDPSGAPSSDQTRLQGTYQINRAALIAPTANAQAMAAQQDLQRAAASQVNTGELKANQFLNFFKETLQAQSGAPTPGTDALRQVATGAGMAPGAQTVPPQAMASILLNAGLV
jgi:hypothetical protein